MTFLQSKELFTYLHMDVMPLDEYNRLFQWLIASYGTPFDKDFKYSFGITLRETGKLIGWCGVGMLDLHPSDKEIYYFLNP